MGNEATNGGGAYLDGTPTLTNCVLVGNRAFNGGGLLFTGRGTVINSTLYNNTATTGGGLFFDTGGTVINSTLYNNTAGNLGGGIWVQFNDADPDMAGVQNDPFNLRNSILVGNTATDAASGHQVRVENRATTNVNLQNNLIEGGAIGAGAGVTYRNLGATVDDTLDAVATAVFASTRAAEASYLRLVVGSPALNVGNNAYIPAGIVTDATGEMRIQDGTVDLGAYEGGVVAPPPAAPILRVTATGAGARDGSNWANAMRLQAALAASTTADDQVWIAGGTYKPGVADDGDPATNERAATFSVPAGVLVYGGFAGNEGEDFDPTTNDTRPRSAEGALTNVTTLSGDLAGDDIDRPAATADQTAYNAARTENSHTVVTITGSNVTLDGLTITAGEGGNPADNNRGAGLYAEAGTAGATLTGCTFTGNTAGIHGGGAWFPEASTLTGCTFTGNTATQLGGGAVFNVGATLTDCAFTGNTGGVHGGGAFFQGAATATLTGCTFTDNKADVGSGGGAFFQGAATLTGCTFTGNETISGSGGGAYFEGAVTAMLTACTFTGNEAISGSGGGANFEQYPTLTNCVLVGNRATDGGCLSFGSGGTVINSTFYNNSADNQGGGIVVAFNTNNPFILQNSLLLGNTAPDVASGHQVSVNNTEATNVATLQNNLIAGGAAGIGYSNPGTGVITETGTIDQSNVAMVFASTRAAEASYLRLVVGSPALNVGNNAYIPAGIVTDAAGNVRIQDGTVDLGAYEGGVVAPPPAAPILRATTTGAGARDGSNWANAMTLQVALAASTTAGDQVWIAGGTYKPHATDRAATFSVPAGVLVYGGFAGNEAALADRAGAATILSGDLANNDAGGVGVRDDNSHTVVTITGSDVTLDGLTITAGQGGTDLDGAGPNVTTGGAGLYAGSGITGTTLTGCTFTENVAFSGGGVHFDDGATLTGCTFTDNRATARFGGGATFSDATLINCTFTGNYAHDDGGGAYFFETATLTSCTFTGNEAGSSYSGGGTYFEEAATLIGCTFTGNEAEWGGGSYFSKEAALTNCVYALNTASRSSGGIRLRAGGTIINSTFYRNTAADQGGGIAVAFTDAFPFILRNSILVGNTAGNAASGHQVRIDNADAANIVTLQNNLIEEDADPMGTDQGVVYTTPGSGNIMVASTTDQSNASVVFASTDAMNANYLRLRTGSPAVNAGNNAYLNNGTPGNPNDDIKTDAVGKSRILEGTVDLGAYESGVSPQTIMFTPPAIGAVGDMITLAATVSSSLPVTFAITTQTPTSGTGNVATLTNNTLTLTGLGTVTITATQAGNADYAMTTATQTITSRPAGAVIFRVTTTGAGNRSGSSWANAMTLQAALATFITAGDQIWIAGGIYKPHADDRTVSFTIPAGILVYGGFAGNEAALADRAGTATILSGDLSGNDIARPAAGADRTTYNATRTDNSYTVVTITGRNVTLDGLTITAGERGTDLDGAGPETFLGGAGLYAGAGTTGATLMGCAFTNNEAESGGGAYFEAIATLTGCVFTGNEAENNGGAVFSGAATLTGCTFTNNESNGNSGGASFLGEATLTGCIFTGNEAVGFGGGAGFARTSTLTGCIFTGNTASNGGGAYFQRVATLTNCVVVSNRAIFGGGVWLRSGGTVINSTFYNNMARGLGGGIGVDFNDADFFLPDIQTSPFILQNSLLIGNTAANAASGHQVRVQNRDPANVVALRYNLIAGGADPLGTDQGVVYTTPGSANITETRTVDEADASAVFASTDAMNANYLRLKAGSRAVNAGNNNYLNNGTPGNPDDDITTDVAGRPRILDRWVDLGAYESGLIPQVITFTSPAAGVVGTDLELTGTASSGLPVTFEIATQTPTSGTGDVATLTDNTLTLTGLGTVTITATQAGNADYAMTTQTQIITSRPAGAAIFRVTDNGYGVQDGSSWANAMTLQAALAVATTAGDQVWIRGGTYRPHNRDREVTFSVSAGVLVYGGFAGGETTLARRANRTTILSAGYFGGSRTVVTLAGANITLDRLTISGGQGGTDLDGTGPNTTLGGAGLYAGVAATGATLTDCIFTNNSADDYGGGAYFEGMATLTGCTFTDNEAEGSGGGAYLNGTATLANCVLVGNSAVNGGGLWFNAGGTVVNLTLYNNMATERGGGIFAGFFTNNPFNLQNSLLVGNTATTAGNAIYLVDGAAPLSATDIEATIGHNLIGGGMADLGVGLYDEDAGTYTAVLLTDATNVALTNTIEESDAAAVFASTDATEDDYLRLKAGSLAVNAGNNDYLNNGTPDPDDDFTTDAEGRSRILDGTVDVGAYESGMAPQVITFTSPATGAVGGKIDLTATGGNSGLPITFAITEGESRATLAGTTLGLTGVGEVVVTASQAGNANYVMTTQTQTITVRNAVIRRVMTSGAGMRDGSSWANAMPLQAALGSAIAGDQVWIADGIYTPDADDRTATFSVPGGVFLYGGFAGTENDDFDPATNDTRARNAEGALTNVTTLSGDLLGDDGTRPARPVQPAAGEDQTAYNAALAVYNTALAVYNSNTRREENSHTVVTLAGANTTLDGLTIQDGEGGTYLDTGFESTFVGAGLYAGHGITGTTLTGCTFRGNTAGNASGAYFRESSTLTDCTFTGNEAIHSYGGGGSFGGTSTLTDCAFIDNRALLNSGGASFVAATLTGCTFTGNEVDGSGSGADFGVGATLTDCVFTGNRGDDGASFYGVATLTGCTFTGNRGIGGLYGGIGAIFYETSTLTGCTFTGNEGIGAIFYVGATLTNCVVVDNSGGGLSFSAGGTVINSTFYNNGIAVGFNDIDTPGVQTNPFNLQNSLLMGNTVAGVARQVSVNNTDATHIVNIQNNLIEGGADPLGTDQGVRYTTPGSANITEENTVDESDVAVVFASTDAMNANYLRLRTGSPAVNTGNDDYLNNGTPGNPDDDIKIDAAGEVRNQGGSVDLGAYESPFQAQMLAFTLAANGTSGAVISLTATSQDVEGMPTGLPVTYASSDITVAMVRAAAGDRQEACTVGAWNSDHHRLTRGRHHCWKCYL